MTSKEWLKRIWKLITVTYEDEIKPAYINEPRVKIIYNPYEECFMWTRLDPRTHVWNWIIEASHNDINLWLQEPDEVQKNGSADIDILSYSKGDIK